MTIREQARDLSPRDIMLSLAEQIDGTYRQSDAGVPVVLKDIEGETAGIVYFATTGTFRIHVPYLTSDSEQRRIVVGSASYVKRYFEDEVYRDKLNNQFKPRGRR